VVTDEELQAFKVAYPERFAELERQAKQEVLTPSQQREKEYRHRRYLANREKMHQWYLDRQVEVHQRNEGHKEEISEYNRQYRRANTSKLKEKHHQRYVEHREEILEQHRQYDEVHKEEKRAYDSQHYRVNREKILEYHKRYFEEHPSAQGRYRANRRARMASAGGSFTGEELRLKYEEYDNRCVYCGSNGSLTSDHMVPLARGGSNTIDNIVPACFKCNNEKHTLTSEEFFASIDAGNEVGVLVRRREVVDEV